MKGDFRKCLVMVSTVFPQVASLLWVQRLEFLESSRHHWDSEHESDIEMSCLAP